jgi:type IV pilus assembly protein PilE
VRQQPLENNPERFNAGVTLIELMVVVAVVAVLAAVALPSYFQYTARVYRADAKTAIMTNVQFMERVFTECNAYNAIDKNSDGDCTDTGETTITLPQTKSPQDAAAIYNIGFASGQPTSTTFTLVATPVTDGPMVDDACGNLSINELGVKSISGTGKTVAECWNR